MSVVRVLAVLGAFAFAEGFNGGAQKSEGQQSITFGTAKVSLGTMVEQVEQQLSGANRHMQFMPDKKTAIVSRDDDRNGQEGQVTFHDVRTLQMARSHEA